MHQFSPSAIRPLLTLAFAAAFLTFTPPATAQNRAGGGTTDRDHRNIEFFVWGVDGSLQPDARVSVELTDGTTQDALAQPGGTLLFQGNTGSKTVVYLKHPALGTGTHEVVLPRTGRLIWVHASYIGLNETRVLVDRMQKPGDIYNPGGSESGAPANDLCDNAIAVAIGSTTAGTTFGASTDTGTPGCGPSISSPGVWYTVVGNGNRLQADICGTAVSWDSKISVYCGPCEELFCIDGNDDSCGLMSSVDWCANAGVEYSILIHGFGGATGDFDLAVTDVGTCSEDTCAGPPENDACEDAIGPLAVPSVTPGTTAGATPDFDQIDCGPGITSPGVWYTVVGTGTTMTASLCKFTDFDSKLSVYCGSCGELTCIDGNDDACGLQSEISWCSQLGAEYRVLVHGFGGANGPFELLLFDDGASCDGAVACLPSGACCLPDGSCVVTTTGDCAAQGGEYAGDDTTCESSVTYDVQDSASAFEDISGSGNAGPAGDDEGMVVPLGFDFDFFGSNRTEVAISTNGYLTFGADATDFSNDDCANATDPNDSIFPFWNDYNLEDGGAIYWEVRGAAPDRRLIVQWDAVPGWGSSGLDTATFQGILFESDNSIDVRFGPLVNLPAFPGDATIGVENADGSVGICISDDLVFDGAAFTFSQLTVGGTDCRDCVTLDFETEDDGSTPLVNGQDISSGEEFGELVNIDGSGSNNGAAIFDSNPDGANAGSEDQDMLVGLGNVLILQDHHHGEQTVPGIFDVPDAAIGGGLLSMSFTGAAELFSVDLIDVDTGGPQDVLVVLWDGEGRSREYYAPAGWTSDIADDGPPGYGTLDLTTLEDQPGFQATATATQHPDFDAADVSAVEFWGGSSYGVDNLECCVGQ